MYNINFWPILVAAIVAFAISALWYSPVLFGKEWMALSKMTDADMASARERGMALPYIIQFIITLVMFLILAFIISSTGSVGGSNGAVMGFLAWLGFEATGEVGGMLWNRKPFKLVLISAVASLLNLVIGGAIIGAWR